MTQRSQRTQTTPVYHIRISQGSVATYVQGVVRILPRTLLQFFHVVCQRKNVENRRIVRKDTDSNLVACLFDSRCSFSAEALLAVIQRRNLSHPHSELYFCQADDSRLLMAVNVIAILLCVTLEYISG